MKKILFVAALMISAASVRADQNVIQLSLTPDIALLPKTTTIEGVSLNIWGENPQKGFTLGFVNGSTGDSCGFTAGLVNYSDTYNGFQWGLVNINHESFTGWQDGAVNVAQETFIGYQSGLVNVTQQEFTGFQLGVVNYAKQLKGVQIGLVNVAMNNPWFDDFPDKLAKGFPIVNWSF